MLTIVLIILFLGHFACYWILGGKESALSNVFTNKGELGIYYYGFEYKQK
jgi:hypothetical protein